MATYNFHRLIMGKVKIDSFFLSPMGIFGNCFNRNVYSEKSSTFFKTFVQIAEFALLPGRQKLLILRKNEPRREKTGFLHMQKQRRRSASR